MLKIKEKRKTKLQKVSNAILTLSKTSSTGKTKIKERIRKTKAVQRQVVIL